MKPLITDAAYLPHPTEQRSARCAAALWLFTLALLAFVVVLGAGCTTLDPKAKVLADTKTLRKGPEAPPFHSITGFSEGLRCMDNTFITYNVHDVSVLVEDITDQTKKVNAGTKDMLISAVSDMTKRSRAVRLVVFGQDSGNIVSYLREAERKSVYAIVPQFDIKGSVSQLDESLVKKQVQAGVGWGENFSIGGGRSAATNVLGLDLTMLSTENLSVVPGVTSSNSVVIFKSGSGVEADATIRKFGANFGMSLSKSEGQSQALRTLVELAAIELFGKLTRTPYWKCVGADVNDAAVRNEIADWFQVMMTNPDELISWVQGQMRNRGYYNGPVDGEPNDRLKDAVSRYRVALGLSPDPKINLEFFSAYLNANHFQVLARHPAPPLPPEEVAEVASPMVLTVTTANQATHFKSGDLVDLVVAPSRDAFVYCYWQDETRAITRFYPNRFAHEPLVPASRPLKLPGAMRFQLFANDRKATERVGCFATGRDVMAELPGEVRGTDFEPLPVTSMDQVRDAFASIVKGPQTAGYFDVHAE